MTRASESGAVVVGSEPLDSDAPYPTASCAAYGSVAARLIAPANVELWAIEATFESGSGLEWSAEHGEEALYLRVGSLSIDGQSVESDGIVIIESGVTATLVASERSEIVHFGSRGDGPGLAAGPLGAPEREGHGVHVIARDDCPSLRSTGTQYYADSSCPTCRVTLLRNWRDHPHRSPSHEHSADELIYVLGGDIHVGRDSLGPGMAIAIQGNYRYGFRSIDGFDFLNYRADASLYTGVPGTPPQLETIAAMLEAGL